MLGGLKQGGPPSLERPAGFISLHVLHVYFVFCQHIDAASSNMKDIYRMALSMLVMVQL